MPAVGAVAVEGAVAAEGERARDRPSPMLRHEFRAMGSKILVLVDGDDAASTIPEIDDWFEEWEQALSRFRADSELSLLNASPGTWHEVSATLWEVYRAALEADEWTGGLVNPLILNWVIRAGYDRSFDLIASSTGLADRPFGAEGNPAVEPATESLRSLRSLGSDRQQRTLCLPVGAGLDFGGVAKGWAAHQAMQRLKPRGPALVSAGGDIALSGPKSNGDAWPIDVEDPFHPGSFLNTIYLDGGGVATSGKDHRNWKRAGVAQHHVIDPRTGDSARTDIMTATVIGPSVMRAEALAKAVLILGSEAGLACMDDQPDIEGLLVLDTGQLVWSRNFEDYL